VLLNLKQAAEHLGMRPGGLRELCRRRQIKFCQNGPVGAYRFKSEWLDAWIDEHTCQPMECPPKTNSTNTGKKKPINVGHHW
jgi:hypothetical protein